MSERIYWISLRRLKAHEFRQTLRYLHSDSNGWPDIYLKLGEVQNAATFRALKQWGSLFLIYLSLTALRDGNLVAIKFQTIEASVPAAFVALAGSLILFVTAQHLQSVTTIIGVRADYSTRVRLRGFSAGAFGLYNGQDEMTLAVPFSQSHFFKETLGIHRWIALLMLSIYSVLLLPLATFWFFLFSLNSELFFNRAEYSFDSLVSAAVYFVLVGSIAFLFFFNIPLPMTKNTNWIRWAFLSTLYPVGQHKRVVEWLDEEKDR